MVDRYRKKIAAMVIQMAKDDPQLVKEMILKLRGSGEIEADDLRYPRTHLRHVARDHREESAEGTTLSLGGSFAPFAFAIADAIFSRSSKR